MRRVGIGSVLEQVGFGLSIFGSLRVGSLRIGYELGRVISGVGHFGCRLISGFVRLWIGLYRVFRSKSVQPISGVGSGINQGQSVQVSDLGSVLPGLLLVQSSSGILPLAGRILLFVVPPSGWFLD